MPLGRNGHFYGTTSSNIPLVRLINNTSAFCLCTILTTCLRLGYQYCCRCHSSRQLLVSNFLFFGIFLSCVDYIFFASISILKSSFLDSRNLDSSCPFSVANNKRSPPFLPSALPLASHHESYLYYFGSRPSTTPDLSVLLP